jgi:hypothetical protein
MTYFVTQLLLLAVQAILGWIKKHARSFTAVRYIVQVFNSLWLAKLSFVTILQHWLGFETVTGVQANFKVIS